MEKEEKENSIDEEEEETEPNEGRSLSSDSASSEELHDALIHADKSSLIKLFEENSAVQLADALLPLGNDQIVLFYSIISFDYDKLGEIFSYLSVDERISLVNNLPKKTIQAVLSNVPNDDLADFLEDITKALRSKILTYLPNKRRAIIEELALFSDDTVGSIRTTEYLSVLSGTTVEDVFKKIKAIGNQLETVRTIFVVDEKNKLLGTERLESLRFEKPEARIDQVRSKDFSFISPVADKESAVPICQEYDLPVLPVVSRTGERLGIVTFDDVMDVLEEESTEDILHQGAVAPSKTPYRQNKVYRIAFSYVIWLVILLIINTFASLIVDRFETELMTLPVLVLNRFERALTTLPVLTAFIPALNDSVGNSSSQTASMVIRAMATGELNKKDYFKASRRELCVGAITGFLSAVFNFGWVVAELNIPGLLGSDSQSFLNNPAFMASFGNNKQLVIRTIAGITSLALFVGITFSKFFASMLPLLAKALHIDPAVRSGPLRTSIRDIITLLLYFGIATLIINSIDPGEIPLSRNIRMNRAL